MSDARMVMAEIGVLDSGKAEHTKTLLTRMGGQSGAEDATTDRLLRSHIFDS
jgi:hypothetical protein